MTWGNASGNANDATQTLRIYKVNNRPYTHNVSKSHHQKANCKQMPIRQVKDRLNKNRTMTTVTVRMPDDVVNAMKQIAPLRGFAGYQTLLKLYISEGLRRDELLLDPPVNKFIQALLAQGVPADVIEQASREIARNELQ